MSDAEAEFREFVAAQMDSLRGLAYLTCGDWQVAEDAVLAMLAKLFVIWHRVDNPEAYARTAAVRAAIDETRRPWWRREQSHGDAMPEVVVFDGTQAVDDRLQVRAVLRQLPVRLRAVLVLRFLEGLSVRETAAALRCPEGTVKAYTSRGLDALRAELTRQGRHELGQSQKERTEGRDAARTA